MIVSDVQHDNHSYKQLCQENGSLYVFGLSFCTMLCRKHFFGWKFSIKHEETNKVIKIKWKTKNTTLSELFQNLIEKS